MEQRPYDAPSSSSLDLGGSSGDLGSRQSSGEDLKEKGLHLAEQATDRLKTRLQDMTDERKSQATGALEAISRALRTAGGNLAEEGLDPVGRLGLQAAERVDRAADYLRRSDLDSLLSDLRGAARNHPEMLVGGALLCGILLGRFLRSSPPSADETGREQDFTSARREPTSSSFADGHSLSSTGDGHSSIEIGTGSAGFGSNLPPRGGWA